MMKTKNFVALLLTLAMLLGLVAAIGLLATYAHNVFEDVPSSHWASAYIEEAFHDGVVNGTKVEGDKRWFEPDKTLTLAEWTVMLSNAFYPGEADQYTMETWYSRQWQVLQNHGVTSGGSDLTKVANRYEVAAMICDVIKDKGYAFPNTTNTAAKVTDYASIPDTYKDIVLKVYEMGVISGVSEGGKNIGFCGDRSLTRAQAATIYCTTKNAMTKLTKVEPADPFADSVAGTFSDTPVTLDLEHHHWVKDYWSEQTEEIRNMTDQDVFNCAVQTIVDAPEIVKNLNENLVNEYYNYSCLPELNLSKDPKVLFTYRSIALSAPLSEGRVSSNNNKISFWFVYPNFAKKEEKDDYIKRFNEVLPDLDLNASNREIIYACCKALHDNYEYKENEETNWLSDYKYGDCDIFTDMLQKILIFKNIPSIKDTTSDHGWLYVFVDGQWMALDGAIAVGWDNYEAALMTIEEHQTLYNYTINDTVYWRNNIINSLVENGDALKIKMAALSYWPASSEFN